MSSILDISVITTAILGIVCMLLEMLNLRKLVWTVSILGLSAIFYCNLAYGWGFNRGFYHNMILLDKFSVVFSGLLILLMFLILITSIDFYKREPTKISDYLSILIFTLCGALALVSFGNLTMFFLGLEVMSISLYVLAGSNKRDERSNEAGMKYFLMGSFASGILLFGIALVYGETGTFDILLIKNYIANSAPSIMFYVGAGMILIAMLFKVSAVPFHFWAPDVYEGSPTLVTMVMSTVAKIAAFAAFYRLFSGCLVSTLPLYKMILATVTVLTITLGSFTALNQDSFKRLLAFSGISNAGYILLAIVSLPGKTENALVYYSLAYGIATIGAFAVAIAVSTGTGSDKIAAFNGLGKRKPLLAAALTIAMLSLSGIPPLAGFFGKYYIFSEAIRNGHIVLTVIAVINSIVGIYYYFKVIMAMYMKDGEGIAFAIAPSYSVVIFLCVMLILVVGICPWLFSQLL